MNDIEDTRKVLEDDASSAFDSRLLWNIVAAETLCADLE